MQPESMPWPMLVTAGAFWLYGLRPALYPEHFRGTSLRYTPHSLKPYVYSAGIIRAFGVLWLIITGVMLVAGIYSRL